jgi:aspartate 4-decarboxylase
MDKTQETQLENLNPFEISSLMMEKARQAKHRLFDAGRGNPNWVNLQARKAFTLLLQFSCDATGNIPAKPRLHSRPTNTGIAKRLTDYLLKKNDEGAKFLLAMLEFVRNQNWNEDEFVSELTHGILGDNYPTPPRVLSYTEKVLNLYFEDILYGNKGLKDSSKIFATEGGTAAIVYLFQSLKENFFIKNGDKIAMNTPIFTPYRDIPGINDYELVEMDIQSSEKDDWTIPLASLDKLKNPEIKLFFLVNPSNPGARALSNQLLDKLEEVVLANPDLMIVTDDVYATFVAGFESVYARLPHNTILVYSFSKLYGATGWRIGDIIINKNNIFDKKLQELPEEKLALLEKRYRKISTDVSNLSFIDRIVADSRAIGLSHTAGLSTPAQMMQMLFSFVHLLDNQDVYSTDCAALVKLRSDIFYQELGIEPCTNILSTYYYGLVDIFKLAEVQHGAEFRAFVESYHPDVDFLLKLSSQFGVLLLDGLGFGTNKGEVRISFSNLFTSEYPQVAKGILAVLEEYYQEFLELSSN